MLWTDDNVAEADADITMTLVLNGSLYQLGTTTVGRFRMLDDDSVTSSSFSSPLIMVKLRKIQQGQFIFRFTATGLRAKIRLCPIQESQLPTMVENSYQLPNFEGNIYNLSEIQLGSQIPDGDDIYYSETLVKLFLLG